MSRSLLEIDRVSPDFMRKDNGFKIDMVSTYNLQSCVHEDIMHKFMDFLHEKFLLIQDFKVVIEDCLWTKLITRDHTLRYKSSAELIYLETTIPEFEKFYITRQGIVKSVRGES